MIVKKKEFRKLNDRLQELEKIAKTEMIINLTEVKDDGVIQRAVIMRANFEQLSLLKRMSEHSPYNPQIQELNSTLSLKGCFVEWDFL